jgi:chromate transporter
MTEKDALTASARGGTVPGEATSGDEHGRGRPDSAWRVFLIFLQLGFTSFGGPVAHIGYFREAFVRERRWLSESAYADLVAMCQFLPGPASSQVGMALGLMRAGWSGALAAWVGFTAPSAIALTLFALGVARWGESANGLLHGLKLVAVAVVLQAFWGMAKTLCPDRVRVSMMAVVAVCMLVIGQVWVQLLVIAAAALIGWRLIKLPALQSDDVGARVVVGLATGAVLLGLFTALLVLLPLASALTESPALERVTAFYRAGSLVFGGGHVVLPLLQTEVVATGWVGADEFLAGYGAAQAVPGPLFTLAAYLGALAGGFNHPAMGAAVAIMAIFLPAFLLVAGTLPFWLRLRGSPGARAALAGTNAAVVGLLLAAAYDPVWTSAVHSAADAAAVLLAFVALVYWRLPPWLVVLVGGVSLAMIGVLA